MQRRVGAAAKRLSMDLAIASQGHCFLSGALNHCDGPLDGMLSVGSLVGESQFLLTEGLW